MADARIHGCRVLHLAAERTVADKPELSAIEARECVEQLADSLTLDQLAHEEIAGPFAREGGRVGRKMWTRRPCEGGDNDSTRISAEVQQVSSCSCAVGDPRVT